MEAANLLIKSSVGLSEMFERHFADGSLPYVVKHFESGSFLFQEGEHIGSAYYINRGLVRLYSATDEGYSKTLFFYKSRTLIGLQELRENNRSLLNATAMTPCETFMMKADDLNNLLKRAPDACFELIRHLADMMALLTREAVNASLFSAQERLAALLLILAEEHGGVEPVHIPYSNQVLADMLGVHRNSVVNCLKTFRGSSCVEKTQNGLIIVNFERLQAISRGMAPKGSG